MNRNSIEKRRNPKDERTDVGSYEKPAVELEEDFRTFVMACQKVEGVIPDPCYFEPHLS